MTTGGRAFIACLSVLASVRVAAVAQQRMTRVSETTSIWGNGNAGRDVSNGSMSVSADGRYVAFDTGATNLLDYDVNGNLDTYRVYANIFVKSLQTGGLVRITTGNGYSWDPVLSADGRFVAFLSAASNLVAGDANNKIDVFLHDRDPDQNGVFDEGNGTTIRVSVDSSGNECNGDCSYPSISDDGSKIVFISNASNLVSGDTNGANDAFLRDVAAGRTTRVSVTSSGGQAKLGGDCASISPDGSVVAFESFSGDIVSGDTNSDYDVFIYDVQSQVTIERVSVDSHGNQATGNSLIIPRCLSHDGSIVAFTSTASNLVSGDTNGHSDVFIRNRTKKTTLLASKATGGQIGDYDSLDATIDAAGDRVEFHSSCTNLGPDYNGYYDIYVHDFGTGATTLVSVNRAGVAGDLDSSQGLIAPAGDVVVFDSNADDLVLGDLNGFQDLYMRDLKRNSTTCISWIPPGQANRQTSFLGDCDVSSDGRWVAFTSCSTNLVAHDNNDVTTDVFVKDRLTGKVVLVSIDANGVQSDYPCFWPSISSDGRFVAFSSGSTKWGPTNYDGDVNVFVCDRDPDGNGVFDEGNSTLEMAELLGGCNVSSISGDGRYLAFSSLNGMYIDPRCDSYEYNIFVRDRVAGTTSLISVSSSGTEDGDNASDTPAFSSDGSVIVYQSSATNIVPADTDSNVDVYRYNLATGKTTLVSVNSAGVKQKGNAVLWRHPISSDGNTIVFVCNDPTFDATKTSSFYDVYLRDVNGSNTTNMTTLIFSGEPNADSTQAVISRDAGYVAFASAATNLFAGDKNGLSDVFWYERTTGNFAVVSTDGTFTSGDGASFDPVVLDAPGQVLFSSDADDLVHEDTNNYPDIFAFDPTVSTGALWIEYGNGFPGSYGVPSLTMSDNPILGTTVSLELGNSRLAGTPALLLVSPRSANIPVNYGPTWLVDLGVFSSFSLFVPATGLVSTSTLPNDPTLAGVSIYLQAVELDPGAIKNFSFTRGLELYFQTY